MPIPLLLAPILGKLAENGLNLLVDAVTSKGKDFVEKKLGIEIPDEESKLTPELIAELKRAEMEHEEFLIEASLKKQELDMEAEKLYLADTQNARNMQIEALRQNDIFSKRFIYYLASGCLAFTAIFIMCVTFMEIPEKNIRFVDTTLGFLLGTLVSTIIYFFFGTSRGSQSKDETIKTLLAKD